MSDKTDSPSKNEPYIASCHCTAIMLRFTLPDGKRIETGEVQVSRCNCSICTVAGALMVYPHIKDIEFESGWDETNRGVYTFGPEPIIEHYFCKTCGTRMGAHYIGPPREGEDFMAITIRTLRHIDLNLLTYYDRDIRSRKPSESKLEELRLKGWI